MDIPVLYGLAPFPPPHLLQETLGPPVYDFSKISAHALNKGGSLYDIYNCI